jgi:hypothetical protein
MKTRGHERRAPVATHVKPQPGAHRRVQVQLDDGRWVEGILQYGREVHGVWSWFVRCDAGSGLTRLGWYEEPRIWSVE